MTPFLALQQCVSSRCLNSFCESQGTTHSTHFLYLLRLRATCAFGAAFNAQRSKLKPEEEATATRTSVAAIHAAPLHSIRLASSRLDQAKLVCGMRLNKWKSLKPQSSGKQTDQYTQEILFCIIENFVLFLEIANQTHKPIKQSGRGGDG